MSDPSPTLRQELLAIARKADHPLSPSDFAEQASTPNDSYVRAELGRMASEGLLVKPKRGRYEIAPSQVASDAPLPLDDDDANGPPPPGIVYLHTAPYGHAASLDRPVDNTDGPDRRTPYRTDVLQRMLGGGPLPVDANGDVALSVSFAVGDSMAPFIPDGHPFFFVREPGFVHGARYALWLGTTQADVIKRVEVLGGGVVALKSDNPAVGTLHLTAGDEDGAWTDEAGRDYELEIRGRVVWPLDTPQAVVGQIADRLTELAHRAFRT